MSDDVRTEVQADPLGTLYRAVRRARLVTGGTTRTIEGRAVLGSAPHVDVVIDDPAVSRIHAEIEPREEGIWIRDLGSRNGTYVAGVRIEAARLQDGHEIRVGSTAIRFEQDPSPVPVELWPFDRFGPLVGKTVPMRELYARIAKVAPTDFTVLIQGETGTGKELIARAVHGASPRAEGPFVVVDCAALPEGLLESEIFGHAKGAFTGAVASRAGSFELAEGGTLFLDEIGELPLSMQPKLLRVLESRTVRRLGETQERHIDVRFVSATHRDLRTMVNQGAFREDLYFRIAVLPLAVPPLRERAEDVPLLAEGFARASKGPPLPADLLHDLSRRPWVGNVRELRNFVERALALGATEALRSLSTESPRADSTDLPRVSLDQPFKDQRERWLDHLEREYVAGLLARHKGNVSAVAATSGLDRTYVHRLIKKHDL